jgi:hypothetical protein
LKHTDSRAAALEEIAGALGADKTLDFIAVLRQSSESSRPWEMSGVGRAGVKDGLAVKGVPQANDSRRTSVDQSVQSVSPAFDRRRHEVVTGAQ